MPEVTVDPKTGKKRRITATMLVVESKTYDRGRLSWLDTVAGELTHTRRHVRTS